MGPKCGGVSTTAHLYAYYHVRSIAHPAAAAAAAAVSGAADTAIVARHECNQVHSECPFLTSQLASAFVGGLQGDGDDQKGVLLTSATCKHAAVYDVEENRHNHTVAVDGRALYEFHLPSIEACVEAGSRQVR